MKSFILAAACLVSAMAASAEPSRYTIDPSHTYPSFEADHMGISMWRGKINKSEGRITFDKTTGDGTVEVTIDLASIDFGQDALNKWATGDTFFDTAKFPKATYKGALTGLKSGSNAKATGTLTLHGVTKPVVLTIESFKCIDHPMFKRDYCGADATATFTRDDFGLDAGKDFGFAMEVNLRIQVEALLDE